MSNKFDFKKTKFLVTGGAGFLGSHLVKELKKRGAQHFFIPHIEDYDLRQPMICQKVVQGQDVVIHLAAKVGSIDYNRRHPAEMFYENIIMGLHLIEEARLAGIKKFVAIASACSYPKEIPVPFKEEKLWDGYPEETSAPYGLAKKMLLVQAQAYRQQYGFNAITLFPTNLYGPGDNFNPDSSHVISALIKKIDDAQKEGKKQIVVWGTGKATREFLYVKDAARAITLATERYNQPEPVNLGAGFEIAIKDLVTLIAKLMKFKGRIVWDKSKPDGQPRRSLDTSRARKKFGFVAKTSLPEGLSETIRWYQNERQKKA